jgi:ubiquinone/menaquinone biosynthesis C-methylase UbiE
MKIRESGMPDEGTWESFFDPQLILRRLQFCFDHEDVADFGCGYGTFSIAAAQLTSGTVHAFDIDSQMVAATREKAQRQVLSNVRTVERDFVSLGTGLQDRSVAYAMLFNVLHAEDATGLLREAFRILRTNGVIAIMHWVHDATTPRGPALSIRPRPEQCMAWTREVGFAPDTTVIPLPPYHYGLVARKPS